MNVRLNDLKTRRERGDLIQIYKSVHVLEKVNLCDENKILHQSKIKQVKDCHYSSLVSEH